MKQYSVEKYWNLLFTHCAVKGEQGIITLRLLIDTGSTYTILPVEALESIGFNPSVSKDKVRITTASGYIIAPRVQVDWVHMFGMRLESSLVVAYTLPQSIYADGLVGMDTLTQVNAVINIKNGSIQVSRY